MDLDLSSDPTHMSQTWSIFLSSSSFPPYETESCRPPTSYCHTWYQEPQQWTGRGGKTYFVEVMCKRQTLRDWGIKMHILSFYVRQFNIHTAVIPSHVQGRNTWACFYESHLTSRLLVKQVSLHWLLFLHNTQPSAPHTYTHFTVVGTMRACCCLYRHKTHKHITTAHTKFHHFNIVKDMWLNRAQHQTQLFGSHAGIRRPGKHNSLKYLIKRQITVSWI